MADARSTLADYVARGHLQDSIGDAPAAPSSKRASELRNRLSLLRAGDGPAPKPDEDVSDFRAAIRSREAAAQAQKDHERGLDVPRWQPQNALMRRVYAAHDAIVSLPAPGGLGILLLIIFLFFLILIPATSKGETRLLLLWEVLLGQKKVDPTLHLQPEKVGPMLPSQPINTSGTGQPVVPQEIIPSTETTTYEQPLSLGNDYLPSYE